MPNSKKVQPDRLMERPNALYSIHNQKTAAGLDALLYGAPDVLSSLSEFLSLNRVILGNGGFCILAAKVCFQPDRGLDTLIDANSIFAETLEEQLLQRAIYYMVPLRGLVLCVVAMPQYRQDSKRLLVTSEKMWTFSENAAEQFRASTGMDVLVAVSPTCFGLDSLPGTFRRTLDLLSFHSFFGMSHGVCGSPSGPPKRHIRLSSEFQEWCSGALNLLLARQTEEFYRHVEQNLRAVRELVPFSLQQYKVLCYQYLDLLCYFLVDHHLADTGVLERTDLFWLVHEPASFDALFQGASQLLQQLTASQAVHQKRSSALLVDSMKSYITLHHQDPNLTVSSLAAEFALSQPVFSAQFIRHAGVGPLEYLNKLRVQTAMELLKTTEDTLPVIAQQSGFGSVSSMHRIFKKFTGMTPAQMRNTSDS